MPAPITIETRFVRRATTVAATSAAARGACGLWSGCVASGTTMMAACGYRSRECHGPTWRVRARGVRAPCNCGARSEHARGDQDREVPSSSAPVHRCGRRGTRDGRGEHGGTAGSDERVAAPWLLEVTRGHRADPVRCSRRPRIVMRHSGAARSSPHAGSTRGPRTSRRRWRPTT